MIEPRTAVTGAMGKTGSVVVMELLKAGYPVRALVHRKDGRSARLKAGGANRGRARSDWPPRRGLRDDRSPLRSAAPQPADLRKLASRVRAVHPRPTQPWIRSEPLRPRTAASGPVVAPVRDRLEGVAAGARHR